MAKSINLRAFSSWAQPETTAMPSAAALVPSSGYTITKSRPARIASRAADSAVTPMVQLPSATALATSSTTLLIPGRIRPSRLR